jgi:formylmethanofuran dehydrogenase subunit E
MIRSLKMLAPCAILLICSACAFAHPFHSGVKPREVAEAKLTDLDEIRETLRMFHGHLGPYATLGFRAGQAGLEALEASKYFGVQVTVEGRVERPFGCFSDGMQVGTGCTVGKGNLKMIPQVPGPGEPTFVVTVRKPDGRAARLSIKPGIPALFRSWLTSDQSEDETFDALMAMADEELWTLETLAPQSLEQYLGIVRDPTSLAPIAEGQDGIVRVPTLGEDYTAISFEIPPGHITPPQAGGLSGFAGVTIVSRGKLDQVGMEGAQERRITVEAGSVFVWPKDTFRALGMQNPYQEACHLVTVYAPGFPVEQSPEAVQEWLEKGAPETGTATGAR